MATLTLSVFARLNIESVIRSQRTEDHDELLLLLDLRHKIGFSDEERSSYVRMIPGFQPEIKMEVVSKVAPSVIEFEKAELRKLASLLRSMKVSTDDAITWYSDVRKQLVEHKAL
jgi:hypothetical protein